MGKLKKRMLFIIFIAIATFFSNCGVKAASFPNNIYCNESGLVTRYGLTIYKKYCSWNGGNDQTKGFCTKFVRDAAHGYNCSAIKWNNNDNTNTAISYAIGYIIEEGTTTWKVNGQPYGYGYVLTESLINKLLYWLTGDAYTYNNYWLNIYDSSVLSKYNDILAKAKLIYNNRKNGKDVASSNSIKKIEIKSATINNNILKVTLKCTNAFGNNTCTSPTVKASIGSSNYTLTKVNATDYSLNLKNIVNTCTNAFNIKVVAEQTIPYYQTQNYSCGGYQSMTPNYVITVREKSIVSKNVTYPSTINSDACTPKTETCQSIVDGIKNKYKAKYSGGYTAHQEYYNELLSVYNAEKNQKFNGKKCEDCSKQKYGEILNLQNPKCEVIVNDAPTMTCDGLEKTTTKFINSNYYCTSTFEFNPLVSLDNAVSNIGSLLYYTKEGNFAAAEYSYSCQLPSGNSTQIAINVPNASLNVNQSAVDEVNFEYQILNSVGQDITQNNKITINSKNDVVKGSINYNYPNSSNYKIQKSHKLSVSNNCYNGGCINLGYGFAANDSWKDNRSSTMKIDLPSNSSVSVSCPYKLRRVSYSVDVLYHGIDTKSPFMAYDGKKRLTGSNWCSNDNENLDDYIDSVTVDDGVALNNGGRDIRLIYNDADNNDYSFIFDVNGNGYLDIIDYYIPMYGSDHLYVKKSEFGNANLCPSEGCYSWGSIKTEISEDDDASEYDVYIVATDYNKMLDACYELSGNNKLQACAEHYIDNKLFDPLLEKFGEKQNPKTHASIDVKVGNVDLDYQNIVDDEDYELVQKYINKKKVLSALQLYYADCVRDGYINEDDLTCIKNIYNPGNQADESTDSDELSDTVSETITIEDSTEDAKLRNSNSEENTIAKNCSATNSSAYNYIINANNADGEKENKVNVNGNVTVKKEPLYSFTLDSSTIKKIRDYNKTQDKSEGYNDFNLDCQNGYKCISKFITDLKNGEYGVINSSGLCMNNRNSFCEVIH